MVKKKAREHRVYTRFNSEESSRFETAAYFSNKSKTEYLRRALLYYDILTRDTANDRKNNKKER